MIYPFKGKYNVTTEFGVKDPAYANYPESRHPGIDFAIPANTALKATIAGSVTVIRRTGRIGRGNEVIITNGNMQVKYCHLNRIDVTNGQYVEVGQQIGLSGNTGYVLPAPNPQNPNAGAHLHFEVLIWGVYQDPEKHLEEEKMIFNEGDRRNVNYYLYRKDRKQFKPAVGQEFKDAIYSHVFLSEEFMIDQHVNQGDVYAINQALGRSDGESQVGKTWKELFYDYAVKALAEDAAIKKLARVNKLAEEINKVVKE